MSGMKLTAIAFTAFLVFASVAVPGEFQIGPYCDNETPAPDECVTELVTGWEHRDGEAFWKFGSALSNSFCVHPKAVLTALSVDPADLESWVDRLSDHTFTVFDHADSQFGVDATEHLADLKTCMIERATILVDDVEVGIAAKELLDELKTIEVRYID